jgi:hypothetical protein
VRIRGDSPQTSVAARKYGVTTARMIFMNFIGEQLF